MINDFPLLVGGERKSILLQYTIGEIINLRTLKLNEVTYGKSHADMINVAIGTSYRGYQSSGVDMRDFGVPDVHAWFVYMDGSVHGYEDGWRWRNYLSPDGNTILECLDSNDKQKLIGKQNKDGYHPYRLCFQIDPYENGGRYCCKFVGAFALTSFLSKDLTKMKYVKVADSFTIGSKGESGGYLDDKTDFIPKIAGYHTPIEELGFSRLVLRILKNGHISYAGELLELGIEVDGELANEIRQKIYHCFGE